MMGDRIPEEYLALEETAEYKSQQPPILNRGLQANSLSPS